MLNGKSGVDTLSNSAVAAGQTVAPTLTDVEKVFHQINPADTNTYTFSALNATGLEQVWAKNGSAVSASITATTGVSDEQVNFTNLAKTTTVGIQGGNATAGVAAGTGLTLAASFIGAAAADTVNVALDGANAYQLRLDTAETVSVASTSDAANRVAVLHNSSIKTLNVSGDGAVRIDAVAGAFTAGSAPTTTTTLTKIDASAANGGVTLGSAANAFAAATTATFTGGSGNDTIYVAGNFASATAAAKYDGGEGVNTIGMGTVTNYTAGGVATAINGLKNFQVLDATAADVTAIKLNDFTNINTFKLSGGSAATAANLGVTGLESADKLIIGSDFSANGASAAISLSGAAAGQTANLELTGGVDVLGNTTVATDFAIKVVSGISTVNIVSSGSATAAANTILGGGAGAAGAVAIDNGTASTFNITGSKDLSIFGKLGTFDATNFATYGAGFSTGVNVDASGFSGKLVIAGANDTVTADTITLGSGGSSVVATTGADSYTAGTGKDVFVYTVATQSTATASDTITSFGSNDQISFASIAATGTTFKTNQGAVQNAVDIADPSSLANALAAASSVIAAGEIGVFKFQDNTYVYANDGDTSNDGGEVIIKLAGEVALTAENFVV